MPAPVPQLPEPDPVAATDGADTQPLTGVRVVTIAVNLPGPWAAWRLRALGAEVLKVEPPTGDPMAAFTRDWYDVMAAGQEILTLDLKLPTDQAILGGRLATADIFITSHRPSVLDRLGLSKDALRQRFPHLVQVAIVGHAGDEADVAGHDLTYQAVSGTLIPPAMPTVLVADLSGAERAVQEALAGLLLRARIGVGGYREVALATGAYEFAAPARCGITVPGALLGGGLPAYGLYAAKEGWVAFAALEPHFLKRSIEQLGPFETRADLERIFAERTAAEWEQLAAEHDIPLAAVRPAGSP